MQSWLKQWWAHSIAYSTGIAGGLLVWRYALPKLVPDDFGLAGHAIVAVVLTLGYLLLRDMQVSAFGNKKLSFLPRAIARVTLAYGIVEELVVIGHMALSLVLGHASHIDAFLWIPMLAFALVMQALRTVALHWYALLEIVLGAIGTTVALSGPQKSDSAAWWYALMASVYVVIRGVDNLVKSGDAYHRARANASPGNSTARNAPDPAAQCRAADDAIAAGRATLKDYGLVLLCTLEYLFVGLDRVLGLPPGEKKIGAEPQVLPTAAK